VIKSTF